MSSGNSTSLLTWSGSGSAADLAAEWRLEAGVATAQLQQKKAMYSLEQARSKLKLLIEYEHPIQMQQLHAAVERARSDELARQATWQIEQSKLKRMQDAPSAPRQLSDERRPAAGAGPDVIRLSIGLESTEDLIRNLNEALAAS